jgi:hypothetical protein
MIKDKMETIENIDKQVDPKTVDTKLDEVFEIAPTSKNETVVYKTPEVNGDDETDIDFQYARENIYNVIERGSDAMEGLLEVARETEHPRAYEVVGQLVDKLTNANKELMGLHKTKKSMSDEVVRSPQNVTNALFVGSTADLQKMLKQKSKEA